MKAFKECLAQMDIHHFCSLVMVETNCFKTLTYSHERMQANVKCLMWLFTDFCLFLFVGGRSQGANFLYLAQLSFSRLSHLAAIFSCVLPFIINLFESALYASTTYNNCWHGSLPPSFTFMYFADFMQK